MANPTIEDLHKKYPNIPSPQHQPKAWEYYAKLFLYYESLKNKS